MEEIKENEYIRLRNGDVTRVKAINEKTFKCKFHKVNCELFIDYIVKHSSNIIDLIEVGDYVNGKEVIGKFYEESLKVLILDTRLNAKCRSEDIKTIVTKEQFANAEYRLEE